MIAPSAKQTAISKDHSALVYDNNPIDAILNNMALHQKKRTRFFYRTLSLLLIVLMWLMYRLNAAGGFDGLF